MNGMNRLLVVLIVIVVIAIGLRFLPGQSPDKGHIGYGV